MLYIKVCHDNNYENLLILTIIKVKVKICINDKLLFCAKFKKMHYSVKTNYNRTIYYKLILIVTLPLLQLLLKTTDFFFFKISSNYFF